MKQDRWERIENALGLFERDVAHFSHAVDLDKDNEILDSLKDAVEFSRDRVIDAVRGN